jgi:hypothetical protein
VIRDPKGEITGRLHYVVSWRPEVKVHDDELLQVRVKIMGWILTRTA